MRPSHQRRSVSAMVFADRGRPDWRAAQSAQGRNLRFGRVLDQVKTTSSVARTALSSPFWHRSRGETSRLAIALRARAALAMGLPSPRSPDARGSIGLLASDRRPRSATVQVCLAADSCHGSSPSVGSNSPPGQSLRGRGGVLLWCLPTGESKPIKGLSFL